MKEEKKEEKEDYESLFGEKALIKKKKVNKRKKNQKMTHFFSENSPSLEKAE